MYFKCLVRLFLVRKSQMRCQGLLKSKAYPKGLHWCRLSWPARLRFVMYTQPKLLQIQMIILMLAGNFQNIIVQGIFIERCFHFRLKKCYYGHASSNLPFRCLDCGCSGSFLWDRFSTYLWALQVFLYCTSQLYFSGVCSRIWGGFPDIFLALIWAMPVCHRYAWNLPPPQTLSVKVTKWPSC